MASNVPAKFKAANLARFVQRGAQVERIEPAVAYWCYYYVLQLALSNKLHETNAESKSYTLSIMEKAENIKSEYALEQAIHDEDTGKAAVERFGLATFQRADNAMRANKATRQTADTLEAAATFLDVLHTWGEPSQDVTKKIKFAKFHARRIIKALNAGEDPTLSNPPPDPAPEQSVQLDPNDPEVQNILQGDKQPSVEDVPDESPNKGPVNQSMWPPRARQPRAPSQPKSDVGSPRQPEYFPLTSPPPGDSSNAPVSAPVSPVEPWQPPAQPTHPPASDDFYAQPQQPPAQAPPPAPSPVNQPVYQQPQPTAPQAFSPPPQQPYQQPPPQWQYDQSSPAPPTQYQYQPPPPAMHAQPPPASRYRTDDASMSEAQKHAKWAISALTFEDVDTAVKELRIALQALGAT